MPISLIAAFLLISGQAPAPAVTPAPTTAPAVDPEKKVCKTIKEVGTRLGGKRECRTKEEWNRIASEQQAKAQGNMGR